MGLLNIDVSGSFKNLHYSLFAYNLQYLPFTGLTISQRNIDNFCISGKN